MNRGKMSLENLAEKALELEAEKVLIVDRWGQGLGRMEFFYVGQHGLERVPPMLCVHDVRFRRDFGTMPKGRRIRSIALVKALKGNEEVEKLEEFLKNFFNISIVPFEEVKSKGYDAMAQILSISSKPLTLTFKILPELVEVGPRIAISQVVWEFRQ
jgi:rRNA maturation protein Rpf1